MVYQSKRYKTGDRWVTCDICGYDYRFSQMRKLRGLNVCPVDYDGEHPLDDKPKIRKKRPLPKVK